MINYLKSTLLFLFFVFALNVSYAQEEVIVSAKTALKLGNSKDLSKFFHNMVELKITDDEVDGANNNYSKTQAEYVLKGFFKDNPPQDFVYVHQGTSKEGLKYAIGKYTYKDNAGKAAGSFRVFMKLKQYDGSYLIDEIDFSKE
jgi:Domain of unknown function (DUF4783)